MNVESPESANAEKRGKEELENQQAGRDRGFGLGGPAVYNQISKTINRHVLHYVPKKLVLLQNNF